jgi:hypothetical protein
MSTSPQMTELLAEFHAASVADVEQLLPAVVKEKFIGYRCSSCTKNHFVPVAYWDQFLVYATALDSEHVLVEEIRQSVQCESTYLLYVENLKALPSWSVAQDFFAAQSRVIKQFVTETCNGQGLPNEISSETVASIYCAKHDVRHLVGKDRFTRFKTEASPASFNDSSTQNHLPAGLVKIGNGLLTKTRNDFLTGMKFKVTASNSEINTFLLGPKPTPQTATPVIKESKKVVQPVPVKLVPMKTKNVQKKVASNRVADERFIIPPHLIPASLLVEFHSCGRKVRHESAEKAKNVMDSVGGNGKQVYACVICNGYHYGSVSYNPNRKMTRWTLQGYRKLYSINVSKANKFIHQVMSGNF